MAHARLPFNGIEISLLFKIQVHYSISGGEDYRTSHVSSGIIGSPAWQIRKGISLHEKQTYQLAGALSCRALPAECGSVRLFEYANHYRTIDCSIPTGSDPHLPAYQRTLPSSAITNRLRHLLAYRNLADLVAGSTGDGLTEDRADAGCDRAKRPCLS